MENSNQSSSVSVCDNHNLNHMGNLMNASQPQVNKTNDNADVNEAELKAKVAKATKMVGREARQCHDGEGEIGSAYVGAASELRISAFDLAQHLNWSPVDVERMIEAAFRSTSALDQYRNALISYVVAERL